MSRERAQLPAHPAALASTLSRTPRNPHPPNPSHTPPPQAEDVALAEALAASEATAKEQQQNLPVTCGTISAPKAKLQKLGKALDKIKKIVGGGNKRDVAKPHTMHPWTRRLLHETTIPNHVVHAASEAYYLDPPGSLTQENLANLVKHTEKVSEEVNQFILELASATTNANTTTTKPPPLELMAAAPQDELAAETLALQSELASVMASNRGRLLEPLKSLMKDIPLQEKKRKERDEDETFTDKIFGTMHKQASASVPSMGLLGAGGAAPLQNNALQKKPFPIQNVLMGEPASEEAFCAVCGGYLWYWWYLEVPIISSRYQCRAL